MTTEEFVSLRKGLKLTQVETAERLGMSKRGMQTLESGESPIRDVHRLAIERLALARAVELGDPMVAPVSARKDAIAFVQMLTG